MNMTLEVKESTTVVYQPFGTRNTTDIHDLQHDPRAKVHLRMILVILAYIVMKVVIVIGFTRCFRIQHVFLQSIYVDNGILEIGMDGLGEPGGRFHVDTRSAQSHTQIHNPRLKHTGVTRVEQDMDLTLVCIGQHALNVEAMLAIVVVATIDVILVKDIAVHIGSHHKDVIKIKGGIGKIAKHTISHTVSHDGGMDIVAHLLEWTLHGLQCLSGGLAVFPVISIIPKSTLAQRGPNDGD
mmetsp:Transcript_20272/g.26590  ORF Transcript_20272/g.26590 Transcript_20272/m.26590 type:complete len:239 (+) Transcript_20272:1545-2261(+)